jgi:flagellar biosynthetic protein FlhB
MADERDAAQRTEAPTQRRIEEALKKGDAPKSAEIVAALMLAAALVALALFAAPAARAIADLGAAFIERPHEFATDGGALARLFALVSAKTGVALAGIAVLFVAAAALAHAGQARPVLSPERMALKLSKLSPIEGFKRIYGPAALFNLLKGVFKIAIVGAILVYALWPDRALLVGLIGAGEGALIGGAAGEIGKLLALAVGAMAVIAALDYAWQRREWLGRLKMTKEEVRRELRETEGDPLIRGRLKGRREARARRRMIAAVKQATVVITNPTHFAVALKYETGSGAAPTCVAKGVDELALRLRMVANDNGVPVVENPPLARALHAATELDAEIPVEHYEAVAKVISFILAKAETARRGYGGL